MEDAHTHILTLSEDKDAAFFAGKSTVTNFCGDSFKLDRKIILLVYDGHGGSKIASHVSRHLHKYIVRRQEYKEGKYEKAIVKGFLECDEAMKTDESLKDEMSGSTAITLLHR